MVSGVGKPYRCGAGGSSLALRHYAQLKLQEKYIGYVRQLGAKEKVEVRKLRDARGVVVAIRKALELVS